MKQKITFYSDLNLSKIHDTTEFDKYEWNSEMNLEAQLVIPPCPVTMIRNSKLIKVKYFVEISGYAGCHLFPIYFP